MAFYKTRLTTTITAYLTHWQLRGDNAVAGVIKESFSPQYKEGDSYIIMNSTLTHYAHNEGFWPDHFILSNNTGQHFYLPSKDQINDTSLA